MYDARKDKRSPIVDEYEDQRSISNSDDDVISYNGDKINSTNIQMENCDIYKKDRKHKKSKKHKKKHKHKKDITKSEANCVDEPSDENLLSVS